MKNIIITITDEAGGFSCDIEVPSSEPISQLIPDVVEVLGIYLTAPLPNAYRASLYCPRLRKVLHNDDTLRNAGVLNGDYVILR